MQLRRNGRRRRAVAVMMTDETEGLAAGGSRTTLRQELVAALRAVVRQCDGSEADLCRGDGRRVQEALDGQSWSATKCRLGLRGSQCAMNYQVQGGTYRWAMRQRDTHQNFFTVPLSQRPTRTLSTAHCCPQALADGRPTTRWQLQRRPMISPLPCNQLRDEGAASIWLFASRLASIMRRRLARVEERDGAGVAGVAEVRLPIENSGSGTLPRYSPQIRQKKERALQILPLQVRLELLHILLAPATRLRTALRCCFTTPLCPLHP